MEKSMRKEVTIKISTMISHFMETKRKWSDIIRHYLYAKCTGTTANIERESEQEGQQLSTEDEECVDDAFGICSHKILLN